MVTVLLERTNVILSPYKMLGLTTICIDYVCLNVIPDKHCIPNMHWYVVFTCDFWYKYQLFETNQSLFIAPLVISYMSVYCIW